MSRQKYGLPPQVFTDEPDNVATSKAQLRTDICPTSFEQGRQFKLIFDFNIDQVTTDNWIKFDCPVDFDIIEEKLSIGEGSLTFKVYPVIDSETGSWGELPNDSNILVQNAKSTAPSYARQTTIEFDAGNVVNVGANKPAENVKLKTSGATAQQSTVDAAAADIRGLPAGTYYLHFKNVAGSGAADGIYTLRFAEVPSSVGEWLDDYKGT